MVFLVSFLGGVPRKEQAMYSQRSKIGSMIRAHSFSRSVSGVLGLVGAAGLACSVAGAQPLDLGVDTEAEFNRLLDAIRSTEYVREDFIVRMRNPRIVASIASLTAYAELNPNADGAQLEAFVMGFDAGIQSAFSEDPDLLRAGTFMRAIRFFRVEDPVLDGTRTDTGMVAAGLLGVGLPDPDNFSATQTRMVRFSQGMATSWHHNPRFADLLLHGLYGVTPDGAVRDGLSGAIVAYLEAQGFAPTLGGVNSDPRFDGVNQSMGMLPVSYTEYQSVLNHPLSTNPLVMNADASGASVRALIDARLVELGLELENEPGMIEGQGLAEDMVLVQEIIDEQQAALMETSDERSLLYGTAILLGQSPLDELGDYATRYEQYNAALLLASDNMAEINAGLGVANHVLTLGIGIAARDPGTAVDSFFGLIGDGLAIAALSQNGSGTPSVDEQIYAQVVALRQQVEDLRMEMNERFDRIELQLGFMYDQMLIGFNALGNQIGDLQISVNEIALQMNIVRSQLSRLEAALYGLAQDVLLSDLTSSANTVLDYRDENNIDLAYSGQNPSFITGSEDFFTFATNTARSQSFAGSRDAPALNLSNADDLLSGAPIARYINDLAVLPTSFGEQPLAFATVPAPEPWAQAASAYAQLARENPWYFAFRYEQQVLNYNSDPLNESLPELDDIIAGGEQFVGVGSNARDEAFFDALIALYKEKAGDLQEAVDDVIHEQLENLMLRTADGSTTFDLWSQDGAMENVTNLAVEYFSDPQTSVYAFSSIFDSIPWVMSSSNNRKLEAPEMLPDLGGGLIGGDDQILAGQIGTFDYLLSLDGNPEYGHRVRWDAYVPAPLARGTFATSPSFALEYQIDDNPDPNITNWVDARSRTIRSGMAIHITTGGSDYYYPINLYWYEGEGEENSRYCAADVILAGGGTDDGWDALLLGMPYGDVEGMELVTPVFAGGEFGDFSFLSSGGSCGPWDLTTGEDYDLFRVLPWSDFTSNSDQGGLLQGHIFEYLTRYREDDVRPQVNSAFLDQSSAVWQASLELDHVVAIINAYIELAAPDAVRRSEIIRSALRAAPGASEIGLRSDDVLVLVNEFATIASEHDPRSPGSVDFDIHAIDQVLGSRVDFFHDEINRALAEPPSVPDYVAWMLDELGSVRDHAFELALDDTYLADGAILVDAIEGVMSNDILQEYRTIEVDPGFGLVASHGVVSMNPDGSFGYTPDAGFSGTDSFMYRLVGTVVEGTPDPADGQFVSDPAMVVVQVESTMCSEADLNGDGMLDFFDLSAFLQALQAMDPSADFSGDGEFDFFDVSSFLTVFGMGCP